MKLIKTNFVELDARQILNIPINNNFKHHKLIEKGTAQGTFSVKSAYYMHRQSLRRFSSESLSNIPLRIFGKEFWLLNYLILWKPLCGVHVMKHITYEGKPIAIKCVEHYPLPSVWTWKWNCGPHFMDLPICMWCLIPILNEVLEIWFNRSTFCKCGYCSIHKTW